MLVKYESITSVSQKFSRVIQCMWSALAKNIRNPQRQEVSFCKMGVGRAIAVQHAPMLSCLSHSWMIDTIDV